MSPRVLYLAIGIAGIFAIALILRQTGNTLPSLGSDQFAYILYMGIWAALIGSAVLTRKESLGQSLRQLVIWIGIFLVVMVGYTYRYEMQDVASNLTGGLIPGSPISSVNKEGLAQITLIRDANGNFNARGAIDGISVTFLVDTGASSVVLSNADARRVGIDTTSLSYSIPVSTANGMTSSAKTTLGSLSIGNIIQRPIRVMVAREGDLEGSLLGMNFINRLHSFEIRGERMILTQ